MRVLTRLLVDLYGSSVCFYADDFAHEFLMAHFAQLVHGHTDHVFSDHDRPRDRPNSTMLTVIIEAAFIGRHPDGAGGGLEGLNGSGKGKAGAGGTVVELVDILNKIG